MTTTTWKGYKGWTRSCVQRHRHLGRLRLKAYRCNGLQVERDGARRHYAAAGCVLKHGRTCDVCRTPVDVDRGWRANRCTLCTYTPSLPKGRRRA